jgi:hypothetical protein
MPYGIFLKIFFGANIYMVSAEKALIFGLHLRSSMISQEVKCMNRTDDTGK